MTSLLPPEIRRGLSHLIATMGHYRRDTVLSVVGALAWMAAVLVVPYVIAAVIDNAVVPGDQDLLLPLVGLLLGAGLVKALGIGARRYFAFRLSYSAETGFRNRMFEHIQRLAFQFHDRTATGDLMARASSDLSQVRLIYAMLPITIANLALLTGAMVAMILLDPVLGVAASLSIPVVVALVNAYSRRVIGVSTEVQERLADLSSVVEEAVAGVRVVKAYGQERQEVDRLRGAADRILDTTLRMQSIRSRYVPIFSLVPTAASVLILWLGGVRVINGDMTIGVFVAFTQYMQILVFPMRITGWFFAQLPRAAAAANRVMDLLATAPEIADTDHPIDLPPGRGDVRFDNVHFAYPESGSVLHDFDLHLAPGSSVAIVGSTGSGKSTLAYLLPRFYDVDSGSVLLDGVDVRQLRLDDLRREVALVFEETFLFSASVRDNIAFGDPGATDEQIRLAARLAQAHEFIEELAEGYDTMVGERGYSLSGGQRQRIGLARAIVRDPRVLILDDATSSVDAVTEAEIGKALETVMAGRTTIIVAHRIATLAVADRVVFIDEGRVAGYGPHQELLASVPRYAQVLAETGIVQGEPA